MWIVDIYITIEGRSPGAGKRKYGYALECRRELENTSAGRPLKGYGEAEGTLNQATLKVMAEALGRVNQSCRVIIHTENAFIAHMIQRNLPVWAGNGFIKAAGDPVANREEWMMLWSLLKRHDVQIETGTHKYSEDLKEETKNE